MGKHSKSNSKNFRENDDSIIDKKPIGKKYNIAILIISAIALVTIILSLISVIFPALIISIIGDNEFLVAYEIGSMGIPLLVTNIVIFSFLILHFKHVLPNVIETKIKWIFSHDLSKKNSLIFLIIILGIYIAFTVNELSIYEFTQYGDFGYVEDTLKIWPFGETDIPFLQEQSSRHVRMALFVASVEIFNNIKIIPYLASILLLVVTYFLTIKFSQKNFSGLLAVILVIQSTTFRTYDTIAVYENFWVLFYLLSIYFIFQKPSISSVFFLSSIFSKSIISLMLPISIIITVLSDISKNKKIFVIVSHITVLIISFIIFQVSDSVYENAIDIDVDKFWIGFTTLASNLRFDILLLLLLLPVSVGLFLKVKNGDKNSVSLLLLLAGTIASTSILEMLTNFAMVYPYRYMPLVVFFAISASSLLSKK